MIDDRKLISAFEKKEEERKKEKKKRSYRVESHQNIHSGPIVKYWRKQQRKKKEKKKEKEKKPHWTLPIRYVPGPDKL